MFSGLLKKREAATESGKQLRAKSFLRLPKISLERWISPRVPLITAPDPNTHGKDDRTHCVTIPPSSKETSTSQVQTARTGLSKQLIIIQEHEPQGASIGKPGTSRERLSRSQERYLSATAITHSTSSRSRSRSRLAFARSQSNPGYQRVIRVSEASDRHKRGTSASYSQRGRAEDKDYDSVEISRGRRSRHSSISTSRARRSQNRTPSPLPELGTTPAGTPCSNRSFEPSTPIHNEGDTQQRVDSEIASPIILTISPDQQVNTQNITELSFPDSDFYAFPESYYKLHCLGHQVHNRDIPKHEGIQQRSIDKLDKLPRYRKPVTSTDFSDGSRLRSVSSGRARIATTDNRISSIPIFAEDPITSEEIGASPSVVPDTQASSDPMVRGPEVSQHVDGHALKPPTHAFVGAKTPAISFHNNTANPDLLPRKPVSFERLRPSSTTYPADLSLLPLESQLPHQKTKSEAAQTDSPLTRSHTRSLSSYSYVPKRDPRPERRSYNTVRFLDSQGQNHERLRRVLGI